MNKRFIFSAMLFSVILLILCSEAVAESLNQKQEINIPAISISQEFNEDKQLNESEKLVLSLLTAVFPSPDSSHPKKNGSLGIYEEYLQRYLSSSETRLTSSKTREVLNKIMELEAVLNLEKVNNYNEMSVDGRELAIKISKEIYKACNLKVYYNMQGSITRITDQADNLLYLNPDTLQHTVRDNGIRLDILIITLSVLCILFLLCVMIARKNQLFKKEVGYDGFKEEGFVQ